MTEPRSSPLEDADTLAAALIERHARASIGAMIAIPVPGVDMAATYAVWARMIRELARLYGQEASLADARALAADLFQGAVLTTVAWFASAKTATTVLKFIPGAGTVTAYLIDATIAGLGARKITRAVGVAAAAYFKSGRELPPPDLRAAVVQVLRDPAILAAVLGGVRRLKR